MKKWRRKLPTAPWILYIASAHPPNFTSLTQVIGNSLGFIPPNSRLVVAGSVTEHVYRTFTGAQWNSLNQSRLQLLFTLSDHNLAAVKILAHVFILPIAVGGGSNIKTAEAIYSGTYVVGTQSAFRGFEKFLDLPEIFTANSPSDFQKAIREMLDRPVLSIYQKDEMRQSLQWDHCLFSISENVQL